MRIADEIEADITVLRLVGRQANAIPGHFTPGPEEYYRINVEIPFIIHLEAELTTRFNVERLVPLSIINDNDACPIELLHTNPSYQPHHTNPIIPTPSYQPHHTNPIIPAPSSLLSEIEQWQNLWKNSAFVLAILLLSVIDLLLM